MPSVSNARNKKILSKFIEVCESDIFLTGQPHCSYHKLVCTVKKFWQRPNYMNIYAHEKHRVAFWPYFCCQSGDHDSRPPLHETSTFEIGQTINMAWSIKAGRINFGSSSYYMKQHWKMFIRVLCRTQSKDIFIFDRKVYTNNMFCPGDVLRW